MPDVPDRTQKPSADDESRVDALLASIGRDDLSMPTRMLERIKQLGRDAQSVAAAPRVTILKSDNSADRTYIGARKMFVARTFVSISAAVMLGLAAIMFVAKDSVASLGDVLDDVQQAETLQLKISRDGETADVWMGKSGNVRWQSSGKQEYVIARGSRLWRIDESNNTAASESNPWRNEKSKQLDVLSLLDLHRNSAKLRGARVSGKEVVDGVSCVVYSTTIRSGDRDLLVEAFADAKANQLRSIACWHPRRKRVGPPIAELKLIARNAPVNEDKFVVGRTLTEDGRIGKVVDRQGMVSLKPMNASRWTPVARSLTVKPGDWIRTGRRGANAVAVYLEAGHRVTLGPATLIELTGVDSMRIHSGVVQVVSAKNPAKTLNMYGPLGGKKQHVQFDKNNASIHRVGPDGQLASINGKPIWLQGFEGTSANESLGSLIANAVDNPNGNASHKLTIGYHKVNVEIRDQIARTTIEESFVNHTNRRMEGVFHFPLPQDASISGFGMWINNELVEADVVEKQRARQIYEEIMRQKKDPALLEWTGGNIFKARVFPIEAHSEKRIRIVYTQVLPLRANKYRYSYGLRSEMLQTTPVRELQINVTVNSAIPLKSIHCPTHLARTQLTEHSGRLDFEQQEYTPTRDFEVVCEVDARQSDVVVVPHRRGDDGYFMVQLTPPTPAGNWQRELLPDGDPLELLLVCDTSGSMDSQSRKLQSEFVSAVMSSLGDEDRMNVAVADVECTWLFDKPVATNDDNVARVEQRLADRPSLGWTDLDRTFASIQKEARKNSHVIYIGDGVVSAGDADPQAFVARLEKLIDGKTRGTFHAVSLGSSFESVVLRAIARLGSGSVRNIDGEQTPQRVSMELLNEIAQPGLRDIEINFRGVQVAAVYPERLPNLAAGTQQILIGRYLPTGNDQAGEIIVTGKRGNETVKYAAKLNLADAEHGNSFVPRLWARSHLDHLLDQAANPVIQDEIIALSEEFHIITPYTSLLVLESDAQREEFGVKRRFLMRDGERFFADGRDNANFELRQKQMKDASDWRIGLRNQILRHLTTLGRNPRLFVQQANFANSVDRLSRQMAPTDQLSLVIQQTQEVAAFPMSGSVSGYSSFGGYGWGGVGGGGGLGGAIDGGMPGNEFLGRSSGGYPHLTTAFTSPVDFSGGDFNSPAAFGNDAMPMDGPDGPFDSPDAPFDAGPDGHPDSGGLYALDEANKRLGDFDAKFEMGRFIGDELQSLAAHKPNSLLRSLQPVGGFAGGGFGLHQYNSQASDPTASIRWVSEIFPLVPSRPTKPGPDKKSKWPVEAVRISRSLLRAPALAKLKGGLVIDREDRTFDPAWKREAGRSSVLRMYSPKRWLQLPNNIASQNVLSWADEKERGVLNSSFLLGQTRKSYAEDFERRNLAPGAFVDSPLHVSLQNYSVEITQEELGVVTFGLNRTDYDDGITRMIEIDTNRNVVLEDRSVNKDGKVVSKTTYGDFVEAGGIHWPTKVEVFNNKGQLVNRTTTKVSLLAADKFNARFAKQLKIVDSAQMMKNPLPTISDAESAAAKGQASFEDRMVLMLRAALVQKWDTVLAELGEIEKLTAGKSGIEWIKAAVLASARKNEDARQVWMSLSNKLLATKSDDLFLARHLIGKVQSVGDVNETMKLVEALKPVFDRQPEHHRGPDYWSEHRRALFEQLGKIDEALQLYKQRAEAAPWDVYRHTAYANYAHRVGEHKVGYGWLLARINGDEPWTDDQQRTLRQSYYGLLKQDGRTGDAVKFMADWIEKDFASMNEFGRYLTSLVMDDRMSEADATAVKWLKEGRLPGEVKGRTLDKLNTAINYATGQRVEHYVYEMDDKFFDVLADTARHFIDHEHNWNIATNVTWQERFSRSDQCDVLRKQFAEQLKKFAAGQAANLPKKQREGGNVESQAGSLRHFDARRVSAIINTVNGRDLLTKDEWLTVIEVLLKKRSQAKKDNDRNSLEESVFSIYRSEFRAEKMLPFMRQRIADAVARKDATRAASLSNELFNELFNRTWSAEIEEELFGLVDNLSSSDSEATRLATAIATLHRVVDGQIQKRFQAAQTKLNDTGNPEKLTRTELAKKYGEFMKAAREAMAKRLGAESKKRKGELAEWCLLERDHLDMQLDRNQKDVAANAWKTLNNPPEHQVAIGEEDNFDPTELRERRMNRTLYSLRVDRAITTLMNLAARRSAKQDAIDKLLAFIAARIKANENDDSHAWKTRRFQMLVALDRPKELEVQLRQWIAQDEDTSHWRRVLARLTAEQGKFGEAIQLVRDNNRDSVLTGGDHALMARWQMVLNDRAAYEASRIETFKGIEEWRLQSWINQRMTPWRGYNNQPVPEELDENVLFAFRALFEKSANPGSHLYVLRQFYTLTRDFRLLRMVPDTVIGRTPQQVYSYLSSVNGNLLREVRNEATADEMMARIKELRGAGLQPASFNGKPKATVPGSPRNSDASGLPLNDRANEAGSKPAPLSAIDARALDLLECMVETRSAEVINQPGSHADAALAALKRAFKHELADGEIRQMASFLDSLGRLKQQDLADEQIRQQRDLLSRTEPGTDDHIHVSWHLANTLFWRYNKRDEGMTIMQAAVRAYEQSHPDGWPSTAREPINSFIGFFEASGQVAAGEQFIKKHIANPVNFGQRFWFTHRLHQLYRFALSTHARVSLGSESKLLENTITLMLQQANDEPFDSFRYEVLDFIPRIFDTAHRENVPGASEQYRKYAFEQMPPALKRLKSSYENVVRRTGNSIEERLGAKTALEFLITCVESYPDRFQYTYQSAWRNHASTMAEWRTKAGALGKLEARLLAIVIAELKRDMRSRNSHSRYMYGNAGYKKFWSQKQPDFIKAAEEVLAERKDSARTAVYVANYMYGDLSQQARAIEILFDLHKDGKLDDGQQVTLISFLHATNRYGESIPILEPLVKKSPDSITYRVYLIKAYARTDRPNQTMELIVETNSHFRTDGRWTMSNISALADCMYDIRRYERAVNYYKELIPRYQRSLPNRGVGDYQLSHSYRHLGLAYSQLGKTREAVDAASSAILIWNRTDSSRSSAMSNLQSILNNAKDLDQYITDHLDKQANETGTDSPIIRRMCGTALVGDGKHALAVDQFKLALQLDSTNSAAREALILALDHLKRDDEAIAYRLEQINIERHNLELYVKLAQKLKDDDALAERAITSIVESAPTEHTHHKRLAELRQGQNRWDDAIMHWEQVAKHQAFEPTGLLGLAEAQLTAKRWDDARRTVAKLKAKEWPSRFSNVETQTRGFENRIPKK